MAQHCGINFDNLMIELNYSQIKIAIKSKQKLTKVVIRLDLRGDLIIRTKPFQYFNSYLNHFYCVIFLRKLQALRLRIEKNESTLKAQIYVFLGRSSSIHIL